jgi:hypothetical protein
MGTPAIEANTRNELAEALRNLNNHAKRQPRAVKLFTADPPTKWDSAHDRVNDLLTLMDLA